MSLIRMVIEDDDNHSLTSSTNSDDDMDETYCHNHRTCSRYASCNRKKHQHSSVDSPVSLNLSNNSRLVKGEIRSVDKELGHRQKYDGGKWRRICREPGCLLYLNGGVYFDNWLCRKHYLLHTTTDISNKSDNSMTEDTEPIISETKTSRKLFTRQSNKQKKYYKRGDMMIDTNGIRQKHNGKCWRPICNYYECTSFIVAHGYCHRHNLEIRKKKSEILSPSNSIQQQNSVSESQITRSVVSPIRSPERGDIQLVRQQWNGTKWYSLCRYYTQDCTRRSCGKKHAYLCDVHYKEHIEKQTNQNVVDKNTHISLSPTMKRKKSINKESILLSNTIDEQNTSPYPVQHIEQYIQTDVTYPLESDGLQQGCILIQDDNNDNDQYQSEVIVYVKKEEENYLTNKRKLAFDVNPLSTDCKLEITKLEF